jgi:CHAD domain-containing protein
MPLAERLRAYLDTPVEALWTLRGPEAAVPLLAPRIRDVYLEASARWPDDDVERVHDVRVATRRLRAALAAVAPLLRRGAEQRARARVQALGRTLGPRRAADVSQAWVSAARAATEDADEQAVLDRLFGLLALRRQRTTERLHAYFPVQVLIEDGLVVLEAAVHSSPDGPRLDVGIDAELRGRVREVTRHLPSMGTPHDDEGHHELRIALKRLRYTCELAQQAWPGRVPDGVLPGLKAMQGALGQLHDRVDVIVLLDTPRARRSVPPRGVASILARIRAERAEWLARAQAVVEAEAEGVLRTLAM